MSLRWILIGPRAEWKWLSHEVRKQEQHPQLNKTRLQCSMGNAVLCLFSFLFFFLSMSAFPRSHCCAEDKGLPRQWGVGGGFSSGLLSSHSAQLHLHNVEQSDMPIWQNRRICSCPHQSNQVKLCLYACVYEKQKNRSVNHRNVFSNVCPWEDSHLNCTLYPTSLAWIKY